MKNLKLVSLLFASLFCASLTIAQTTEVKPGKWALGIGLNIVEDGGEHNLADIFDSETNHFSSPFVFNATYFMSSKFSLDASLSFNKYKAGKIVDGYEIQDGDEPKYMAFDLVTRFNFINKKTVLDPYVFAGFGYSKLGSHLNRPDVGRMNFNAGAGLHIWFSDTWAFNLNLAEKFGIESGDKKEYISNHAQFSFGVFHRFSK